MFSIMTPQTWVFDHALTKIPYHPLLEVHVRRSACVITPGNGYAYPYAQCSTMVQHTNRHLSRCQECACSLICSPSLTRVHIIHFGGCAWRDLPAQDGAMEEAARGAADERCAVWLPGAGRVPGQRR